MVINEPEWKCGGPLMANDIGQWCTIENSNPKITLIQQCQQCVSIVIV